MPCSRPSSTSGGQHRRQVADGGGAGVHEDQRAHLLGVGEDVTEGDDAPHGVTQQVEVVEVEGVEEAEEVGVEVVEACIGRVARPAVAPVVEGDDPPVRLASSSWTSAQSRLEPV